MAENYSWRLNIWVVGLAEGTEMEQPVDFFILWLPRFLKMTTRECLNTQQSQALILQRLLIDGEEETQGIVGVWNTMLFPAIVGKGPMKAMLVTPQGGLLFCECFTFCTVSSLLFFSAVVMLV